MHDLVSILVPLGCGCVLPIMIVWFIIRENMNKTNQRTQIVLAAIEKNPDMDIEELMNKISPQKKQLKEKLLTKLLCGGITAFMGIAVLVFCAIQANVGGMPSATLQQYGLFGAVLLGIGIAFLINYKVGKKLLAKEIDAEEKLLVSQAENK